MHGGKSSVNRDEGAGRVNAVTVDYQYALGYDQCGRFSMITFPREDCESRAEVDRCADCFV